MALIILEGLDRTGKSSVAQMFERQGYEIVHMSAPNKALSQPGYTGPSYLDEMVEMMSSFVGRDVVLDRSHYGELIWPQVYGRAPQLDEESYEILRELEEGLGVTRILMQDPNAEAHWQRCVDNKEPLTKVQFVKARALYSSLADKYEFNRRTLKDFPEADQPLPPGANGTAKPNTPQGTSGTNQATQQTASDRASDDQIAKTKEQLKLDRANAIDDILSKRILKSKGPMYDDLERSLRNFLNGELGKIFGNATNTGFSNEEVELLKFFCKHLKDKETK